MPHYIGSNDRETLAGIEEILKKRIADEMRNEAAYKTQRDRRCATYAVSVLQDILGDVIDAMTRGRTPTPEQLASIRVVLPPDVAAALMIDNYLDTLGYTIGRDVGWWVYPDPRDPDAWKYRVGVGGMWSPPFPDEWSALDALSASLREQVEEKTNA